MAQYRIPDPEDLMECPYDKVHMVRAKRFQYHLMKCRKNYTGKDFVTCPFNAKHEMPKPELRHHITNCPDKNVMDPEISYNNRKMDGDNEMLKGCTDVPVYSDINIEATEDWDSEASVPVRLGPMYDQTYYSRVRFHDPTALNKQQRKVLKDNRLTPEQKMEELMYSRTQRVNNGDRPASGDSLRLPKTTSKAAMPTIQPVQQPQSSVFAYSVCGRGRGRGMLTNGTGAPFTPVQPVGIGRGLVPAGGVGRGNVPPPPPGFCVPNVNQQA